MTLLLLGNAANERARGPNLLVWSLAACIAMTMSAPSAQARDACPAGAAPSGSAQQGERHLIGSYDGEDATIDPVTNDVTDDGHLYHASREGGYRPLTLSDAVKRNGRYAYRFEVGPGDGPKDRVEIISEHRDLRYPASHHDLWKTCVGYGFSVFFPADFAVPANWLVFQQVKQHSQKYQPSPNIAWEVRDNRVVVLTRTGGHGFYPGTAIIDRDTVVREVFSEPLDDYRGRWVDFAAEFRLSDRNDGFLAVYRKFADEAVYKRIVRYSGPLGYTGDSETDNVQIHGGLYRGRQNLTHVLYQDDVRIGTRLEDVIEPGASIGTPRRR